ncbi:PQQ-like beta-propeller repeat protein [Paradesertivirga mongoliensis]|uniref:PQQ-like beta-propeller repeat protein n=1 Tax=Paradesertivirga mongoliensis TaxID=2100740 RepID=A0ABW4ZMV8_9SPHI|nr:PQQ-like beta-propeller repeat protein [Pedobacter mongoliensis]
MSTKHLLKVIFIILYLTPVLTADAQTNYKAGYAKASIEPTLHPFSLALAGYGAPPEGRFTLRWSKKESLNKCTSFTGTEDNLFSISNGELLVANPGKMLWRSVGKSENIKLLTGDKKRLFAVDGTGQVLHSGFKKRLNWKKIGSVDNAEAITILDNIIYAANKEGTVTYAAVKGENLNWQRLSKLSGIQSLTGYRGCLYALTVNNDLLKYDLKNKNSTWLKIARYNGVSYDVDLRFIAIAKDVLYGLDDNNTIYEARHQTTGDLSVTALSINSAQQTVVLVGADLCGFDYDFISSVKHEIFRKYHVPPSAILINASHTHFAPVTQRWTTWGEHNQRPDSTYLYSIVKPAMVDAIERAIRNMTPSELYFGRGKTSIGANRTFTREPIPYDDDVDVVNVVRKRDGKKTVLFLAGCHPVFKNEGIEGFTISPNYPGITRSSLKKDAGISGSLFIQGCGGDINPVSTNHINTGKNLASDVREVLNKPMQKLAGKITFNLDSMNFPVKRWSREEIINFKQQNSNKSGEVFAETNMRWADLMLSLDIQNRMPVTMPVYIQTINIGSWKLVGLSREVVTEYSIGIKKLWPDKIVSVAGYCNDVSSYLPTEMHIKTGVYEGVESFFWYAQPALFPESVYQKILDKISKQD